MRASKLRNRVKIYKKTTVRPIGDSPHESWEHILTLSASFEPLSVKDVINAKATDSQITARCVLRYRDDIDSAMRLEHRGFMYEIDGDPLPDAKSGREYITLMLKSVKNGR